MKVIEQLCDTQADPILVAVFSDAGVSDLRPGEKPNPGRAANDLLHGSTRMTAHNWLKSRVREAAVLKTLHPYPVNSQYEPIDKTTKNPEAPAGQEDEASKIIGYVSIVQFKAR